MDIISVNSDEVFAYLAGKDEPVMEIVLIRHFAGDYPRQGEEALFRVHFSIYHTLYRLKTIAGEMGYYLHIDPMRVRVIRIPHEGCSHYFPEEGDFCRATVNGTSYCSVHSFHHQDESVPHFDPLREFYLNPDNISFGNSHILKRIMKGIIVYGFKKGEIEEALAYFNIVRPNRKRIQKKYRELARQLHPDSGHGNINEMKRLNHAYNILKEVFIV